MLAVLLAGMLAALPAHAITDKDFASIDTNAQFRLTLRIFGDDYATVTHESNIPTDGRGIPMVTAYKFDTMTVCETMVLRLSGTANAPAPIGCINYEDLAPDAKKRFDDIRALTRKYMTCVRSQPDKPGACSVDNTPKPKPTP